MTTQAKGTRAKAPKGESSKAKPTKAAKVPKATPTEDAPTLMLRPDQIIIDERENTRYALDPESLNEFAHQLKTEGQTHNIVVTPRGAPKGKYRVIVGFRRAKAITEILKRPVRAIVKPYKTRVEELQANVAENTQRKDYSTMDAAQAVDKLVKAGLTQTAAAKALGKTASWASKILSLLKLHPEAQAEIHRGVIDFKTALEIGKLTKPKQKALVAEFREDLDKGNEEGLLAAIADKGATPGRKGKAVRVKTEPEKEKKATTKTAKKKLATKAKETAGTGAKGGGSTPSPSRTQIITWFRDVVAASGPHALSGLLALAFLEWPNSGGGDDPDDVVWPLYEAIDHVLTGNEELLAQLNLYLEENYPAALAKYERAQKRAQAEIDKEAKAAGEASE